MFAELMAPLQDTERGQQIGLSVFVLASILSVVTFGYMLYTWKSDFALIYSTPVTHSVEKLDETLTLSAKIPELHLFGIASDADSDFLPVTNLQLRLTGIVKEPDGLNSHAVIAASGNPGKIYRIGDELVSGIIINAINTDNVILEHNGRLEKLPLVRAPLLFRDAPSSLWQDNS
jgi:type II secretory pathway component PulC